ncbi:Na+/H+ antiporter subunit E [Devosia rhizoryzae]|uniref:Na+/H+ antiporter subunit E n=1 Tax=Devosia rhizoryzae TaxID=2774137 RepID=A0ABX7C175_9HYPH|nr:Na+/H+ antiporter subunit E [Devosia rhizoryzae]QQR37983.1 Na+/H+ antiporter subunit E [Devosia rhizoryzae]
MSTSFLVVILSLVWAAVTGSFSGLNLLFGGIVGAVVVTLLRNTLVRRNGLRRWRRIVSLALLFIYELFLSAIKVALVTVRPNLKTALRPAIIAVPLSVKSDGEITLLANLITLTPGTLSIDVSPDRSVLYVHALTHEDRDAVIAGIVTGFETKVREVFE